MEVILQEVKVFNVDKEIGCNETIDDYLDLDKLAELMISFCYYYRSPKDCPFGLGNWIIDIHTKDDKISAFKFSKKMTEKRFVDFLKPLTDRCIKK